MVLKENYSKPVGEGTFWNNSYIEYESSGDRNKTLSFKEYLNEIELYLKNINNIKKSDTWKIQFTIAVNFTSSKDIDEEQVMHSKSGDMEIMTYDKADESVKELFESLFFRYKIGVETLMKSSDFIFNCVYFLYCKCHKISPNCGRSYIESPD